MMTTDPGEDAHKIHRAIMLSSVQAVKIQDESKKRKMPFELQTN